MQAVQVASSVLGGMRALHCTQISMSPPPPQLQTQEEEEGGGRREEGGTRKQSQSIKHNQSGITLVGGGVVGV